MLSKAKIQFIRALQLKKFRALHQRFVVEGDKMVRECLENESNGKNTAIEAIFATQDWFDRHKVFLKNLNTDWENRAELVSEKELGQISGLQTPNCAVAVVQMPPPPLSKRFGGLRTVFRQHSRPWKRRNHFADGGLVWHFHHFFVAHLCRHLVAQSRPSHHGRVFARQHPRNNISRIAKKIPKCSKNWYDTGGWQYF